MIHSQNSIDVMTTEELINGLTNGTIESLESLEDHSKDGKMEGRGEGIQEAISALENL